MTIALESMAVEMPAVEGHPNRTGFRGVLTVVDAVSQRAPSGSKGHRVMLMKKAAEAALPSLLGMALDYAPAFDRHDVRRKVGVITGAEIVDRNLEVSGYLYAKDFPEIVEEIAKAGREVNFPSAPVMQAAVETPRERWSEGASLRASLAAAVGRIRGLAAAVRGASGKEGFARALRGRATGASELGMSFEVTDITVLDARATTWILTKVTFTGAAILRRDKAAYQDTWIELST